MVNLTNTCILVRTKEENEMLLKEAEKQGFTWTLIVKRDCKPLPEQSFPDILRFYEDKIVSYKGHINSNSTFYEASELLGTKEMTAIEFADRIADISNCPGRSCSKCVLGLNNTKCNKSLCDIRNWKDNINELLEIAKVGKGTVPTPEKKAISTLEKFIENPDHIELNDEFIESLKLVVEKLKEVK